ncbi:winged helix-turn-helix domain-containing protein [Flavobacterium sp. MXW15]|uniref:Winged helix-turn-helix domain-containing protein n=1 Tax=Xanthomonas chitinilytica TaxID=2989819 RepID=A0ABT3JUZ2_9XANT|nr:winged helix-turn-helix domain-containing protein [Xanthomonas sp. H13-6]MCW4453324.1 winged helix-turn-helix domain-containing protein [Flavobacterium sp. MXW15]MCW4472323.1 winged helix-turn-helix domain-containing protein [Xanthomonas sp. H13-6]
MPVQPSERYRFDGVAVDAIAHTLHRDGQLLSVEPKAFAVLLLLLRHAGELVPRDQLLDAVWGHRHVTPGVLTRVIAQLRAALDDDSQQPRYIQTQHALGYRFIGHLQPAQAAAAEAAPPAPASAEPADGPVPVPPARMVLAAWSAGLARRLRGRWWRIALLAVLALLVAGGLGWWLRPPAPAVDEASIAVMPFTSPGDAADERYFAVGLAMEMHDALAGVPGLKVAARQYGGLADREGRDPRRIGRILGVATVLEARVQRIDGHLRVDARLSDTQSGATLWSGSYDRQIADLFALQGEIAAEVVKELLGRLPGDHQRLQQRLAPTRDLDAYDNYLHGLDELLRPSGEGSHARALEYFRRALAKDPGFARAQAGICRAEIARLETVSDAEAFQRARLACTRAAEMGPDLLEVRLAMADIARVGGDPSGALALYRQAAADPALRADAEVGMARSLGALGNEPQALEHFTQALAVRPGDGQIYKALGYHHWLRGRVDQAIAAYTHATWVQPDDSRLWSSLGGLYLAGGDTEQAARAFNMSLSIEPNAGALTNLGAMKFDAGDYHGAADMFQRAADLQPDDYLHWGNLGDALAALPATAGRAQPPYRRAAELAQRYVEVKNNDAYALGALAWYRANLGEHRQARDDLEKAQALGSQPGEVALWCAQVLSLLDDPAGAQDCVATALERGIPRQRVLALLAVRGFAVAGIEEEGGS